MFVLAAFLTLLVWILKILGILCLIVIIIVYGYKIIFEFRVGMCNCDTRMDGKTVLITGGNSGIGLETARDLAKRGARVIIASRNDELNRAAVEDIIKSTGNRNVTYKKLNLGSLEDVKSFAEEFNKSEQRLDVLVCNSGAGGLKRTITKDGVDIVMQINHLGHFLLVNLLMEKLSVSKPSRIVVVSSVAHKFAIFDENDFAGTRSRTQFFRYANTKLCNVLWTRALAKKLPNGITANSLHPGIVKTNLLHKTPTLVNMIFLTISGLFFKNAVQGAQTTIYLCVAPELEGCSGGYYVDCKLRKPSSLAYDDHLVERVWTESFAITKKYVS